MWPSSDAEQLAGLGIPDLDLLVVAAGGQPLAVGRELGVVEDVAVAGELADRARRRRRSRSTRPRPGPATPEAATSRAPSGVKCTAVTFPGKLAEQSLGPIGQARALARHRVERDLGIAGDGQPVAVARGVERDDRAHLRVRRESWARPGPGGRALRPAGPWAPASIQASSRAISPASGRGSPLGGMLGFATPVSTRIIRLPLGSPGRIAGPCSVPFCSEVKDSSENLPSRSSSL